MEIKIGISDQGVAVSLDGRQIHDDDSEAWDLVMRLLTGARDYREATKRLPELVKEYDFNHPTEERSYELLERIVDKFFDVTGVCYEKKYPEAKLLVERGLVVFMILWNVRYLLPTKSGIIFAGQRRGWSDAEAMEKSLAYYRGYNVEDPSWLRRG